MASYAKLYRYIEKSENAKEVERLTQEIKTLRELAGPVLSHFDIERIGWREDRIMVLQEAMDVEGEEFKQKHAYLYP